MFLLIRTISAYTHHDIILGIFENIEKATIAKEFYIKRCNYFDKWREQAYKDVNLDEDILIQNASGLVKNDNNTDVLKTFYIVSCYIEGFGQITRIIESIFVTENAAKLFLTQKESEEPEYEPCWYKTEKLIINDYYFNQ